MRKKSLASLAKGIDLLPITRTTIYYIFYDFVLRTPRTLILQFSYKRKSNWRCLIAISSAVSREHSQERKYSHGDYYHGEYSYGCHPPKKMFN